MSTPWNKFKHPMRNQMLLRPATPNRRSFRRSLLVQNRDSWRSLEIPKIRGDRFICTSDALMEAIAWILADTAYAIICRYLLITFPAAPLTLALFTLVAIMGANLIIRPSSVGFYNATVSALPIACNAGIGMVALSFLPLSTYAILRASGICLAIDVANSSDKLGSEVGISWQRVGILCIGNTLILLHAPLGQIIGIIFGLLSVIALIVKASVPVIAAPPFQFGTERWFWTKNFYAAWAYGLASLILAPTWAFLEFDILTNMNEFEVLGFCAAVSIAITAFTLSILISKSRIEEGGYAGSDTLHAVEGVLLAVSGILIFSEKIKHDLIGIIGLVMAVTGLLGPSVRKRLRNGMMYLEIIPQSPSSKRGLAHKSPQEQDQDRESLLPKNCPRMHAKVFSSDSEDESDIVSEKSKGRKNKTRGCCAPVRPVDFSSEPEQAKRFLMLSGDSVEANKQLVRRSKRTYIDENAELGFYADVHSSDGRRPSLNTSLSSTGSEDLTVSVQAEELAKLAAVLDSSSN
ncbi:hypothetical protein AAMO2058_000998800 [Amorphochlora amoebiformis]